MESITEEQKFRIERVLSDAGCDDSLIREYLALEVQKKRKEQYRLLSRHKISLLKELHLEQFKIDCLDHMVCTMREEDKKTI